MAKIECGSRDCGSAASQRWSQEWQGGAPPWVRQLQSQTEGALAVLDAATMPAVTGWSVNILIFLMVCRATKAKYLDYVGNTNDNISPNR
ncbi:MAG TPA: hypothetical protein VH519_14810 [Hyphomicrobiaceae bacterium]